MRTGWFGAPNRQGSSVHLVDSGGVTFCGIRFTAPMKLQVCATGAKIDWVECGRCKRVYKAWLAMLDGIHRVVIEHSGNKHLADTVWELLRADKGKGAVSPPSHYRHLTAHDEALPGEWTMETLREIGRHCPLGKLRDQAIIDAHNSGLRVLVDALEQAVNALDRALPQIRGALVMQDADNAICQGRAALQPYSTQKLSAQSRATEQKEKHASD